MRQAYLNQGSPPRRMGRTRSRLWALRRDGARVQVEISLSPFQSEDGRLIVVAMRDVTDRIRMEEERTRLEVQLRQAQKLESLGSLAGGIAHDFNNLLMVIGGNVELAGLNLSPSDPLVERLDNIAKASARARDLVGQILAFSRQQPRIRSVSSIQPIVAEVAGMLRSSIPSGIEIAIKVGAEIPQVFVDPTQIQQVLMNLVTNAWHAIEGNTGRITIHVEGIDLKPRPDLTLLPGRYACIQVSDNGTGMSTAVMERIFEPFFTTKAPGKGTGLGLSVVHGIVVQNEGGITVESVPREGTTFSVYLPESKAVSPPPILSGEPARKQGGSVLLIDDEEDVLLTGKQLMEQLGYKVTGALQAAAALADLRADPLRFDIVVTDQNMPVMGGLEVAEAIGAIRADLPVVICSGNRLYSDTELAASNVRCHLSKPYSMKTVNEVLSQVLNRG